MAFAAIILLAVAGSWLAVTAWLGMRDGLGFRHGLLFAPLRVLFRISTGGLRGVRAEPGTVFVVGHQSRLEPAIMLSLLPETALHVLDAHAASSMWMEPYRTLGRTIAFNPGHLFFSRRLVRMLKGKGQLAVYVPEGIEPSMREFRIYRAVARIAHKAEAKVVVVHMEGSDRSVFALDPKSGGARAGLFPQITIAALPPRTIAQLMARSGEEAPRPSLALLRRMREVRGETVAESAIPG